MAPALGGQQRQLLVLTCFVGLSAAMIGKDEIVKETTYKGMVACDVKVRLLLLLLATFSALTSHPFYFAIHVSPSKRRMLAP